MSRRARLRALLRADQPLILAGVQDGLSARLAERAGFAGLWASGFCISASKCLPDVGLLSMHEHLAATLAIHAATDLPVVADVDDGFGDAINVVRVVREYEAAGIAGICLEDNQHPKRNSLYAGLDRKLVDSDTFARKISAAIATRRDPDFLIVARTEALVAGFDQDEAHRRASAYADAGADVILVHARAHTAAPILEFGRRWRGRLPLAAVPSTYPDVSDSELHAAGYRLIVFANQGLRAAVAAMDRAFRTMARTRSLTATEPTISPLSEIFAVVDYEEVNRLSALYVDPAPRARDDLFHRLLLANPAVQRERPALVCADLELSYGELIDAVRSLARQLTAAGVGPGDRVALILPNQPEFIVALLGITAIAAIAVPIDPGAGEPRHRVVLADTAPRLCLVAGPASPDAPPRHTLHIDRATRAVGFTPPLPTGHAPAPPTDHTDALILYSAGSTGRPKGVVLTHQHLLSIARTLAGVLGTGPEHRDLVVSPMTHSGGLQRVTATFLGGGTVVLYSGLLSVPALLEDITRFHITGMFTSPPLLRALLRAPDRLRELPPHFRSLEVASAPVRADELARLRELVPHLTIYLQYGLTECSRALILDARARPDKLHTVGLPTRDVEVMACDERGAPLPRNHEGELALRAPQRTDRYWNLPDLDATRFRDGWFYTGDFGLIDDDGFVVYRGRRDDMINCGGNSYFPAEVELLLGDLPGVEQSLVAGVPDPQNLLTHVPWLFVVPTDPARWSIAEFMRRARSRLPAHMVPREVVIVPSIPTTHAGKLDRRETVRRHGPPRAP